MDIYINNADTNLRDVIGELILNISECYAIVSVIPNVNILTMQEYALQRKELSEEGKGRLAEKLYFDVKRWISQFLVVLDYYMEIKDENSKKNILNHVLKTIGNAGYDDTSVFSTIYQIILCMEEDEDEVGTI